MKRFTGALLLSLLLAVLLPNVLFAAGPEVLQFVPPPAVPVPLPPGVLVACCYSPTGSGGEEYCQLMGRIKCLLVGGKIVEDCMDCGLDWTWEED
jgi:hypothetical protein